MKTLLKSAVDAAEYIGVPGVEWTREKAKAAGKTVASIFKLHPASAMLGVEDPTAGMTYDPRKKFVIHPDDSPVIKKKEQDKETRINKSRSWF